MSTPVRVLVIDDDFRVAGLHRDIVQAHGGFVALEPVRSLRDADVAVRADRPDLLLVDGYLPDGDGVAFVRSTDIDAFVLSAATDAPSIRRALRAGALGYLAKPFEARALADLLDRYLRFRNLLAGDAALEQSTLDRALGILHAGGEGPSLARSATEQLILEAMATGECSAAELAGQVGISRATAQRHLSTLATRGLVDVRLRYGAAGRPEHRYALAGGVSSRE